ncbi:hypothetical protein SK128_019681 [Halocaridina rubra]|uniref:C2H2-type domain-containing protein n=1 Tax=Halocaridina rubra TaxID=373956 RepID=A0AAN9AGV0_HALRR
MYMFCPPVLILYSQFSPTNVNESKRVQEQVFVGENDNSLNLNKEDTQQAKDTSINKSKAVSEGNDAFTCGTCNKSYASKKSLTRHSHIHSETYSSDGNFCKKSFVNKRGLKVCAVSHQNDSPFMCNICPKLFKTKRKLKAHSMRHSSDEPVNGKNWRSFRAKSKLKCRSKNVEVDRVSDNEENCNVVQETQSNALYEVKKTNANGINEGSLQRTKQDIVALTRKRKFKCDSEGRKAFTCNVCSKSYASKGSLTRHFQNHSGLKPYQCKLCGKSFVTERYLKTHILTHSEEKPFACDICHKAFKTKNNLKIHAISHSSEKPFECAICKLTFKSKPQLKSHSTIHSGEKPFVCEICSKGFRTKANLKEHITFHIGEKPFQCNICQKSFTTKQVLKVHSAIHLPEKPHVCYICNKSFYRKEGLKLHMSYHNGDQPYVCKFCNKSFPRKTSLKIHVRIHTGEKPHVCKICDKSFAVRGNLKKHLSTHSVETSHICKFCQMPFIKKEINMSGCNEETSNACENCHVGKALNPNISGKTLISIEEHHRLSYERYSSKVNNPVVLEESASAVYQTNDNTDLENCQGVLQVQVQPDINFGDVYTEDTEAEYDTFPVHTQNLRAYKKTWSVTKSRKGTCGDNDIGQVILPDSAYVDP